MTEPSSVAPIEKLGDDVINRQVEIAKEIAGRINLGEPFSDADVQQLAESVTYVAALRGSTDRALTCPRITDAMIDACIRGSDSNGLGAEKGSFLWEKTKDGLVAAFALLSPQDGTVPTLTTPPDAPHPLPHDDRLAEPDMTVEQIRQWIDACNHEPARKVLRRYLMFYHPQEPLKARFTSGS